MNVSHKSRRRRTGPMALCMLATQGFPSIGGCGGENSLMMADSASKITDFDSWMLRYVWSKIKDESGRFS